MKKLLLIAVPLIGLAACNSGKKVEAENASVEDVAAKVRAADAGGAFTVRPGKWQSNVVLEKIDIPGMPAEAKAQIQKTMAKAMTGVSTCLTPEQAKKPKEDFFSGTKGNCTYEKFRMDGGKIEGVMRCGDEGRMQRIVFDGNYEPEAYDMHMESTVEGPSPMSMAMKVSARRVGECDDKTAAK